MPPPGESAPDVPGDDATIKAAEETVDSRAGVRVHNLDKRQLFYMPDPSLALICLNLMVIPFPLAEVQSRVVATAWANLIKLDYERDFKDDEESKKVHVYGYPYEFEVQVSLPSTLSGVAAHAGRDTDHRTRTRCWKTSVRASRG